MPMKGYAAAIMTMLLLSCGQVLLKLLSTRLGEAGWSLDGWRRSFPSIVFLGGGVVLTYAVVTALWLYALIWLDLSRAFSFAALTFIFVPILSFWFFGDRITVGTIAGAGLIVVGIIVSAKF